MRVFFGHPERSFYASQLIRDAGTGSGAAQSELARLEESGLIVARRIGHQKHYQANAASPLYSERHTVVTDLLEAGEPEHVIEAITGHLSRKMLEHYSHQRLKAKGQMLARLEGRRKKHTAG